MKVLSLILIALPLAAALVPTQPRPNTDSKLSTALDPRLAANTVSPLQDEQQAPQSAKCRYRCPSKCGVWMSLCRHKSVKYQQECRLNICDWDHDCTEQAGACCSLGCPTRDAVSVPAEAPVAAISHRNNDDVSAFGFSKSSSCTEKCKQTFQGCMATKPQCQLHKECVNNALACYGAMSKDPKCGHTICTIADVLPARSLDLMIRGLERNAKADKAGDEPSSESKTTPRSYDDTSVSEEACLENCKVCNRMKQQADISPVSNGLLIPPNLRNYCDEIVCPQCATFNLAHCNQYCKGSTPIEPPSPSPLSSPQKSEMRAADAKGNSNHRPSRENFIHIMP